MFSLLFSIQSTTTTSFTSCCHFSLSLQLAPLIVTDSLVHLVVTAATTVPLIASPPHFLLPSSLLSLRLILSLPLLLLHSSSLLLSVQVETLDLLSSWSHSPDLVFYTPLRLHHSHCLRLRQSLALCFHHGLDLLCSSPTFSHPLCFSLTPSRDSLSFIRVWAWLMVGSLTAHLQSLLTQQGPLRILVLKELYLCTNYSDPLLALSTPKPCSLTGFFAATHQYQV